MWQGADPWARAAKKASSQKDWLEVALNGGLFDGAGVASGPYFAVNEEMGDAIVLRVIFDKP